MTVRTSLAALLLLTPLTAAASQLDGFDVHALAEDRGISEEEAAERLAWQDALGDLQDAAVQQLGDDAFGGIWIDVEAGDRVQLGVVAGTDVALGEALLQQHGVSAGGEVVEVERSLASLEALNATVRDALVDLGGDNLIIGSLRPDLNVVQLEVPTLQPLPPDQAELVDQLVAQGAGAVVVGHYDEPAERYACVGSDCDRPLRGGVAFDAVGPSFTPFCSTGFIAESRYDGLLYAMTAGHCLSGAPSVRTGGGTPPNLTAQTSTGAGLFMGQSHNFIDDLRGDVAIIAIQNDPVSPPENWVFVRPSAGRGVAGSTRDEEYEIHRDGRSFVGMRICASGMTTGTSCGEVRALGVTETFSDGATVTNLGRSNLCMNRGDSGGPLYARHTAYGTVVGGINLRPVHCRTYYNGIRGAENLLNVDVLH